MAKKTAMTRDDWWSLDFEISELFDGAPIAEEDLFAGRSNEVLRMLRAVFEKSKHIVLYGERGVGKTSLSNIFWKRYNSGLQSFVVAKVQANLNDDFSSLWVRALQELKAAAVGKNLQDKLSVNDDYETLTPTQIRRELSKCNPNIAPIIIIDEFNEIVDEEARVLTANLIKEMYDYSITTTVIMVGVAENINQLMEDHQSIDRALIQVPLKRMDDSELKEIIDKRISRTRMKFDGDAKWTIVTLSRGLPYFTQTLSKHAARAAVAAKTLTVTTKHVETSLDDFISDSDASFKEAYKIATRSNQANFFKESLLACALASTDNEGFFTANDVAKPYSGVMGEVKRFAHYDKHLRRFTSEEGGYILIKRGGDRQQTYRFKDPMMQPYVIIKGIQSGMIDAKARANLLEREQPLLIPIDD